MTYDLTIRVKAKDAEQAIERAKAGKGKLVCVEPVEVAVQESASANTHAIGFHVPPDYLSEAVAPDNP